ncbi:MAG: two pore domain potassium channel family protein [Proteobacteria bacterium]|nr:two pore domain potassium channel family protein [Pseudomonadota bacterium]NIS69987.1 two pore domain potassium channel family protein [Pseudomonadota bacterium]
MTKEFHFPFIQVRIGRFLFLLISILLLFVVRPFLEGYIGIGILLEVFFSFILISGAYAVSRKKYLFIIGLLLGIAAFVTRWSTHFVQTSSLPLVGNSFMIVFFVYVTINLLSYLFSEREVTADVIMAAVCGYIFIGLIWAFVFSVIEALQPGSFRLVEGQTTEVANFTYYSFVTQTTLGYGDITPLTAPARSISLLEAIIGQLYLAVLIARLVGIHISQSSGR